MGSNDMSPKKINNISNLITGKSLIKWGIPILVLLVLALFPLWSDIAPLIYYLPYLVLAVAWTIFSGTTGYVSLATAAFYGVGIYAAALYGEKLPIIVCILIGGVASFILALLVGAITLRLRGIFFSMFTFGLVLVMKEVIYWWELTIENVRGYFVVAQSDNAIYYYLLGLFIITIAVAYFISKSKYGLALSSIGENEDAAEHTGVNVTMTKILTFSLSAFFMGATGAIMATKLTYIDPVIAFDPMISFSPALMATFGGVGNIYGPVLGAVIFYFIQSELQTGPLQSYYKIIFGAILVITIMYLPNGLIGIIQRIIRRINLGAKRAPTTG